MESAKSAVWRQAENRMHTARGALAWLARAMTDTRARRLRALADLIRAGALASQEEVTARLRRLGFAVTQATVSRDLEQLGAVKVKRGGVLSYALARPDRRRRLEHRPARADPAGMGGLDRGGRADARDQDPARLGPSRRLGDRPCPACPRSPAPSRATTPCSSRVRDGVTVHAMLDALRADDGPGESDLRMSAATTRHPGEGGISRADGMDPVSPGMTRN